MNRCTPAMFVCLLCLAACNGAAVAAPPADRSLTSVQYAQRGGPPADQVWSGKDYAALTELLKNLANTDRSMLPQYKSARSGAYFDQMIAPANFAPLTDDKLPAISRMAMGLQLVEGPKQLAAIYIDAGKPNEVFDNEVCELLGYQLQMTAAVLNPITAFLDDIDIEDPQLRQRLDAVSQMRLGLAAIVDGCLVSMKAQTGYRAESRRRLAGYLLQTLPKIGPELPAEPRSQLAGRLRLLADRETDAQAKATLQQAAGDVRIAGNGRFDDIAQTLATKARNLPKPLIYWSWHTSRQGGFRGQFPGVPTQQVRARDPQSPSPMQAIMMAMQADDGTSYTIMRVEGDMKIPNADALDQLVASIYPQSKLVVKTDIEIDGHKGRQMLLRSGPRLLIIRALAINDVFYEAIVEYPNQPENRIPDDARKFVESMQITEPTK